MIKFLESLILCLCLTIWSPFVFSQRNACEHTDQYSGWERIKANNSAGVNSSLDYVYYRIKRCTVNKPMTNSMYKSRMVCHPGAQVQVKAPEGMPGDSKTGELTAGYLVFEFFSVPTPIEVLFTVRSAGDVYENDYVSMQQADLKSIKMLLMDDVLARLGKGPAISGTAEKAIIFDSPTQNKKQTDKTPENNSHSNVPPIPSVFFNGQKRQYDATERVASLSKKLQSFDEFEPEQADQTKLPVKPRGVAEFIKQGMWSDMRKEVDTSGYQMVPLDVNGNFLLIDKTRVRAEKTDADRIRHFYPGISYPKQLPLRPYILRSREAVMGVRG